MDFIFKVDPIRRSIKVPDAFTVLTMDHNIHKLVFICPYYEDFAFDSASIVFMVDAPDGKQYVIPAEEYESFPNSPAPYVKFTLTLKSYITSVVGYMSFCITADIISSGNVIEKSWHSKNITISIGGHIDNDDSEDIPEEDVPTINQRLNNLDSKVGRLQTTVNGMANGTPPTASNTSGMNPEVSPIYVNTTDGNWYYWDGSAWQIGGTYGGAVTDTTLSISGAAADAKAVGDALADFTIEVDDTLTEQGKAADAKAVGDALADKADTTDVEAEITALDDRVTALESESGSGGDDVYEDRGDAYTLLSPLEDTTMKETGYRLTYNSSTQAVTKQSYASGSPAIHYIPKSAIIEANYPRLWLHRVAGGTDWSVFADYDPTEGTYTALTTMPSGNTGKLVRFENIADGHYLAFSAPTASWKTGLYIYLARLYICPRYTAVHSGWDIDVCEDGKPITLEMSPINLQYPAFYIDMQKYGDCLVRLVNIGTGTTTWNFIAMTDYTSYASRISDNIGSYFSMGDFSAWYYNARYLTFFFRTRIDQVSIKLTMGYVPIENARKCKEIGKWGAQFALHNCDTPNELIFACAIGSILDIDVCRTLDGYFVCIHATTINGHTIPSTNLEDMELTYNQMEVTRALKTLRKYGATCYFNFRETTSEQAFGLTEKAYNYLGRVIVYDDQITGSGSVLANHLDKYYVWCSGKTLDELITNGAKLGRIYAPISKLEGTSYNEGDIISCKTIESGSTLSNYTWDGERAVLWINSDVPGFVRG